MEGVCGLCVEGWLTKGGAAAGVGRRRLGAGHVAGEGCRGWDAGGAGVADVGGRFAIVAGDGVELGWGVVVVGVVGEGKGDVRGVFGWWALEQSWWGEALGGRGARDGDGWAWSVGGGRW